MRTSRTQKLILWDLILAGQFCVMLLSWGSSLNKQLLWMRNKKSSTCDELLTQRWAGYATCIEEQNVPTVFNQPRLPVTIVLMSSVAL